MSIHGRERLIVYLGPSNLGSISDSGKKRLKDGLRGMKRAIQGDNSYVDGNANAEVVRTIALTFGFCTQRARVIPMRIAPSKLPLSMVGRDALRERISLILEHLGAFQYHLRMLWWGVFEGGRG
jgi:hypothetical protein